MRPVGGTYLVVRSPQWTKWTEYLLSETDQGGTIDGRLTARLLRRFLGLPVSEGTSAVLGAFRHWLGPVLEISRDARTGQGWIAIGSADGLFADDRVRMAVGEANAARRRSVEAHEIGHLCYASLVGAGAALGTGAHGVGSDDEERFCWEFSAEFCVPEAQRQEWTLQSLQTMLLPREREVVQRLPPPLADLSFIHVRALARRHRISIRACIAAIDRTRLLDAAQVGIAVMRYGPNRYTNHEPTVRVWQAARPSWGYIVRNQRASKQGFGQALLQLNDGIDQVTSVCDETLRLRWRNPDGQPAWITAQHHTHCAYTPVDVTQEGRYLVAAWFWPQCPPTAADSRARQS